MPQVHPQIAKGLQALADGLRFLLRAQIGVVDHHVRIDRAAERCGQHGRRRRHLNLRVQHEIRPDLGRLPGTQRARARALRVDEGGDRRRLPGALRRDPVPLGGERESLGLHGGKPLRPRRQLALGSAHALLRAARLGDDLALEQIDGLVLNAPDLELQRLAGQLRDQHHEEDRRHDAEDDLLDVLLESVDALGSHVLVLILAGRPRPRRRGRRGRA